MTRTAEFPQSQYPSFGSLNLTINQSERLAEEWKRRGLRIVTEPDRTPMRVRELVKGAEAFVVARVYAEELALPDDSWGIELGGGRGFGAAGVACLQEQLQRRATIFVLDDGSSQEYFTKNWGIDHTIAEVTSALSCVQLIGLRGKASDFTRWREDTLAGIPKPAGIFIFDPPDTAFTTINRRIKRSPIEQVLDTVKRWVNVLPTGGKIAIVGKGTSLLESAIDSYQDEVHPLVRIQRKTQGKYPFPEDQHSMAILRYLFDQAQKVQPADLSPLLEEDLLYLEALEQKLPDLEREDVAHELAYAREIMRSVLAGRAIMERAFTQEEEEIVAVNYPRLTIVEKILE
ncbi:hypothetical protein HY468_04635 [Candidatus Roizmanbacteria bacterium]|nr:hypothetical protein [Candidatus Roizmanbacteria bacterium]